MPLMIVTTRGPFVIQSQSIQSGCARTIKPNAIAAEMSKGLNTATIACKIQEGVGRMNTLGMGFVVPVRSKFID